MLHCISHKNSKVELITIGLVSLLGILVDFTLALTGVIEFKQEPYILPYWFMLLWPLFSSTLNNCLKIFSRIKLPINAIIGASGGTLAYVAGTKINSNLTINFLYIVSIVWALLFPLSIIFSQRISHSNAR